MDTIKKGGTEYSVRVTENSWILTKIVGKLTVDYNVSKDVCRTFEELKRYVESEDMF